MWKLITGLAVSCLLISSCLTPVVMAQEAGTHKKRGRAFYMTGQYDKAIQDCTQVITLDSNYTDAYKNRGFAWNGKGESDSQ